MEAFQWRLIDKVGADGVYADCVDAVGVRESEQPRRLGAERALGFSVKIHDGNLDVLYALVAEILEQLGIGTPSNVERSSGFARARLSTRWALSRVGLHFRSDSERRELRGCGC